MRSPLSLSLLLVMVGCGERARHDAPRGSAASSAAVAAPAGSTARTARASAIVTRARRLFGASPEARARLAPANALAGATGRVRVEAPLVADGPIRLRAGAMHVEVRPRELAPRALEAGEGLAVFADVREGAHLLRRVDDRGVEDLFHVERPHDRLDFAFDVSLHGVAGLRLVDGDLELLDEGGVPRLRAPAPIVFDATGASRRGAIEIEGCAFDASAQGPWGRAPVAPGASTCTIVARVDGRGLAFPVLVDPAWESTADAKYTHARHHALLLPSGADAGKVLVFGGTGTVPSSSELYDPATGTWATGGALPADASLSEGSRAVVLANGTVVVSGGLPASGTIRASRRVLARDPASGTWSSLADMSVGRAHHAMEIVRRDGAELLLVAGGLSEPWSASSPPLPPHGSAELYDPALDAWTAVGGLATARAKMGSAAVDDGRVIVVGGEQHPASAAAPIELASIEVYDPKADAFVAGPKLAETRSGPAVVALGGGRVLVAGGYGGVPYEPVGLDTVEIVDVEHATASMLATKLREPRRDPTATRLADGRVLLAGGDASKSRWVRRPTGVADLFVPDVGGAGPQIVQTASLLEPRTEHAATLIPGMGVLVTGGFVGATEAWIGKSAEVFDTAIGSACASTAECPAGRSCVDGVCCLSSACGAFEVCNAPGREGRCVKANGASCGSGAECASGFCVDGVCCDQPCDGTCRTCALAGKVGTCSFAKAGTDPRAECVGGADPTCAHRCDGAGACGTELAPVGTPCGPSLEPKKPGDPFCEAHVCDWYGACIPGQNRCGLTCVLSTTCDEASSSCTITGPILANACLIDGVCHWAGEIAADDPCKLCDPGTSKTEWSVPLGCDAGTEDAGPDDAGDATDANDADEPDTKGPDAFDDAPAEDAQSEDARGEDAASDATVPEAELPEASTCAVQRVGARTGGAFALSTLSFAGLLARRRRRSRAAAR